MDTAKPTILVTGVSGNLGRRLLEQLSGYSVVGIDLVPPTESVDRFVPLDLGKEETTRQLHLLIREVQPISIIHLAFVIDPQRTGVIDIDRMWQINVAGTARVMEAITEANRIAGTVVRQFIFPSSVSAYGSDMPAAVTEDAPLQAHTLPYAIHKKESDMVVQQRAPSLRGCGVFILRPHIFAGATVENYLMGAFRGTPNGKGARAARMRQEKKRLPCMLPYGQKYLDNKIQFVHVDDMARLIAWLLKREPEAQRLTILNVAGRGEPMTFAQCIEIAKAKLLRVPGKWAMRRVLQFLWNQKISAIPPDAVPYMTGQYIMNTERLKKFLGDDHERVITKTNVEAFADSF
ncbi:MAG TPA: NAD-dependent epimerase/dehydratase family protein [Candidatus Acidoferrum sp.]|nr:NAD-dependent epimerase/dehydratase family protein [Terriglobales bacterium]HUK30682.1 NAD-dependent epimerase/dehydratase family protein [Candidatus Acidoferrum sp.]